MSKNDNMEENNNFESQIKELEVTIANSKKLLKRVRTGDGKAYREYLDSLSQDLSHRM